jgi:hypothetical protein
MQRSFAYSKRSFVVNMAFLGALIMLTSVILLMTSIDIAYLAAILLLELALFLVLGLSPLFTEHEVQDGVLVLRQGWYFRARVPLLEIRHVNLLTRGPKRTGVFFRLLSSTLFVTTQRTDLIEVELLKKHAFGWALGKKADRIVFDVEEPGALIKLLEGKGSLSPVKP